MKNKKKKKKKKKTRGRKSNSPALKKFSPPGIRTLIK
jgi:hypothetical protein